MSLLLQPIQGGVKQRRNQLYIEVPFICSHKRYTQSFFAVIPLKLYVAGCYLTQQQQFEMQEKLKDYIRGTWPIQ